MGGGMKRNLLVAMFLGAFAAGCAMDVPTRPDTFAVDPANAAHLRGPQSIALKNAYAAEAKMDLDPGKGQTWSIDQKQMTDTAMTMLGKAVEKQGIKTQGPADKSVTLQVRVEQAFIHQRTLALVAHANVRLSLDATFGDGTGTMLPADNNSPLGPQRAFEGALMVAINKLFLDEKFVAYVNKAGPDTLKAAGSIPLPVVAAAPVAAAAITTAPVATARSSGFPQVGDNWTYYLIQRGRDVSPAARTYVVKVVYSSEAKISDQVSLAGRPPEEWDHAKGRYLVTQIVSILSPYLGVFEEPAAGSLGEIVTSTDKGCQTRERCEVSGRIVGRELVRVPAGEFEAIKVTVNQAWRDPMGFQGGTSDARRELTGWYVAKTKRFVKFSSRTKMGKAPDFDLELMSYEVK
jgi:hypothetical protein